MGLLDSFFSPRGYYIPYGTTPKERTQELLNEIKWHADEINKSSTVFDFSYSYKRMSEIIDELIWLNEKKKVFMYPTPRSERTRIQGNISATINDFVDRAIGTISEYDEERAEKISELFDEMENDETFSSLISVENQKRMADILTLETQKQKEASEKRLLASVGTQPELDLSELNPMKVIEALESNLGQLYKFFYTRAFSADFGKKLFADFTYACSSSKLPLMAEVRLESLFEDYRLKFESPNPMSLVDYMEGHDFEQWCASLLIKNGFINVKVTPGSGDQGVDITAEKDGVFYAIQCKCYSSDLGNKPIQEVYAGKEMYRCQVGVVMTNRYFTDGAKALAKQTRVLLWDRDKLQEMIDYAKLAE